MMIILVIFQLSKTYIVKTEAELKVLNTSPKDYTIHVYGLNKNITEKDVKEFFEIHGREDKKPAKVVKVNFPYKIREYIENIRKTQDLIEKISKIEEKLSKNKKSSLLCCKNTKEARYNKKLESINEKISNFETVLLANNGKDLLIGQAFVTFDTQSDARMVEQKFGIKWPLRVFYEVLKEICCCKKSKNAKNKLIHAKLAHDPSDIYWENLDISYKKRVKSQIKTFLITIFLIAISFVALIIMKYESKYEIQSKFSQGKSLSSIQSTDLLKLRIYSIWPSVCITLVNFLLFQAIKYFSLFEYSHSITAHNSSVAIKLTFALFTNNALILI